MSGLVSDLPQFLRDLIACPPRAGDGVHFWPFKVARHLHAHRDEQDIFYLIKASLADCGRTVPDKEIWAGIRNSKAVAWRANKDGGPIIQAEPAWPEPDLEAIDSVVRSGCGVCDVIEQSPFRFDEGNYAEAIIDTLFPDNPLLCVAKDPRSAFATRRREAWRKRDLSTLPLIVPNPMLRVWGTTEEGKPSQHTKQATAQKVYQGIEFDFSEKCRDGIKDSAFAPLVRAWAVDGISIADACSALILHLRRRLQTLVVVCYSGGKSVHAWWRVFHLDAGAQRSFMEYAVTLGADHATWCRSQFVRIPDGMRDNGVRQTAYYLDPAEAIR
jgi:hypothetical protein